MVTQSQREKFQTLMRGTIISLCQNVLDHKSEIKVEVFIGITLDKKEDFHFSIVETMRTDSPVWNVPPPTTENNKYGSLLEKLMTRDLKSDTVAAVPSREPCTNNSVVEKSHNVSYSDLLRSLGEMSRQDNIITDLGVHHTPSGNSGNLHGDSVNHNAVNQAQVVIPINFAIHSPSHRVQASTSPRKRTWTSPRLHGDDKNKAKNFEFDVPDSTDSLLSQKPVTGRAGPVPIGSIRIKEEMVSDEEMDQQENDFYQHSTQTSLSSTPRLPERPTQSYAASSSPGILMSLLCEKSPINRGRRRGRPRKRADDPPRDVDKRVLIGLTDYLPGFKQGDLNNEKPPRCEFSSRDIIAKTRKIILLNSGPFSSVRMVHRGLQGMRANEIGDVMRDMTRPRTSANYVGEYKQISMPKIRQGRKVVGIFYKCPPELLNPGALKEFDLRMDDYVRFYNQVFKYDRTPQPLYFESVEMFSPFYGTFGGERSWRGDPSQDPTASLDIIHDYNNSLDPLGSDLNPGQDSESSPTSLRITQVKSELLDWDEQPDEQTDEQTDEQAVSGNFQEDDPCAHVTSQPDDQGARVTSTQKSWPHSEDDLSPEQPITRDEVATATEPNVMESPGQFSSPDFSSQPVFPQPQAVSQPTNNRRI